MKTSKQTTSLFSKIAFVLSVFLFVGVIVGAAKLIQERSTLSGSISYSPSLGPVSNLSSTSFPAQTSAPLPLDETGRFRVFTNTEYGFSFRFPADWTAFFEQDKNRFYFRFELSPSIGKDTQSKGFWVLVLPNSQHLSPEDVLLQGYDDRDNVIKFGSPPTALGDAIYTQVILNPGEYTLHYKKFSTPSGWAVKGISDSPYISDVRTHL